MTPTQTQVDTVVQLVEELMAASETRGPGQFLKHITDRFAGIPDAMVFDLSKKYEVAAEEMFRRRLNERIGHLMHQTYLMRRLNARAVKLNKKASALKKGKLDE